jgi:hypothetical protein
VFFDEIEAAALYLEVIESILSSDSLLMTLIMSFACDELALLLGFSHCWVLMTCSCVH